MINTLPSRLHSDATEARERHVISLAQDGIGDVLALGRYEYHAVRPGLTTHTHPGAIEICYLERGRQIYRLRGRDYLLTGGDLFVVPPDEEHDTANRHEDCGVLYWLILRVHGKSKHILDLPARDSDLLRQKLMLLTTPHFPVRPIIKNYFQSLFDLHASPPERFKSIRMKHLLLGLLLEILHAGGNLSRREPSPDISHVLRKIRSNPEENFQLSDLAQMAGLSLSRFKAKFKDEVGIAPREYILREKIETASRMLRHSQLSITTIAMNLGFSSSQYFATVFKRFTQKAPGTFRAG